jgi:hypothetical protein
MSSNVRVEKQLAAAKQDYLEARITTIAAAAKHHKVTKKQLCNRLKGIGPLTSRPVKGKN